jgi:hypothetical protein
VKSTESGFTGEALVTYGPIVLEEETQKILTDCLINDLAEFECEGFTGSDKRRISKVKADPEHIFFIVGNEGTVVDSLILGSKVGVYPSSTNSLEIKISSNHKGKTSSYFRVYTRDEITQRERCFDGFLN